MFAKQFGYGVWDSGPWGYVLLAVHVAVPVGAPSVVGSPEAERPPRPALALAVRPRPRDLRKSHWKGYSLPIFRSPWGTPFNVSLFSNTR